MNVSVVSTAAGGNEAARGRASGRRCAIRNSAAQISSAHTATTRVRKPGLGLPASARTKLNFRAKPHFTETHSPKVALGLKQSIGNQFADAHGVVDIRNVEVRVRSCVHRHGD